MTEFRKVTADFSVASQMDEAGLARAVELGFKTIINNRPDGEAPDQAPAAQIKAAAEAAGLQFYGLPYSGPTPPGVVAETALILERASAPVLAYCRTGTRSVKAWALAQALAGTRAPDEIIALAARAGYDLHGARGALETLAPKS